MVQLIVAARAALEAEGWDNGATSIYYRLLRDGQRPPTARTVHPGAGPSRSGAAAAGGNGLARRSASSSSRPPTTAGRSTPSAICSPAAGKLWCSSSPMTGPVVCWRPALVR